MDKHKELKEKLTLTWRVYIFAQEVYYYTKSLHTPKTEAETKVLTSDYPGTDIRFILHIMLRVLVIEVCKLFSSSKTEKYSINSLLNYCVSNSVTEITPIFIAQSSKRIQAREVFIQDLIQLRNKLYAHSDSPATYSKSIYVDLAQIKDLLDIAYSIIQHMGSVLFDTHYTDDTICFDPKRFIVLDLIARADQKRREDLLIEAQNMMINDTRYKK